MGKLKLTVNEDKTRICTVPEGEFHFLGFTFGRMYSRTTGQARLALRPSKKSIQRMVEKVQAHKVAALQPAARGARREAGSQFERTGNSGVGSPVLRIEVSSTSLRMETLHERH